MNLHIKTCKLDNHINIEWLRLYKKLAFIRKDFVEVYDVDFVNEAIHMEKVNGQNVKDYIKMNKFKNIDSVCIYLIDFILWCENNKIEDFYVNHLDLAIDNMFVSNKRFIMLDPNSVVFSKIFMYDQMEKLISQLIKILKENDEAIKLEKLKEYDKIMDSLGLNCFDDSKKRFSILKKEYINGFNN
jgi:tRNA A-37 threonylcarbamoyl transferase component Bud32